MTRQTSSADTNKALDTKEKVIRLIRISGAFIILFGAVLYFNLGELSDLLDFDDQTRELVAGAFLLVGLMDIVLIPRVLQSVKTR